MSTKSAFAFEEIKACGGVIKLDHAISSPPEGVATSAFITAEGDWRYRYDGGDPTVDSGHVLEGGSYIILDGELNIRNFRAIESGYSNKLSVTYERV